MGSNIKFKIKEEWLNDSGLYNCPECNRSFSKMGLIGHFYRKHDDRGINFLKKRKMNAKIKIRKTKEEISKNISNSMKLAYKEGRAKGWAHINKDKNKRSYPEKFFLQVFENNIIFNDFQIEEKYPYGKYVIDFLIVELKLIIEIDGQQHYRTNEAIEHDKLRDEFFLNEGFKIYRIKWKDVYNDHEKEILELINFISNIEYKSIRKYNLEDIKPLHLCKCGNLIKSKVSKICNSCRILNSRIIKNRPTYQILVEEVNQLGYCAVGRKYNVSDNCIRKWIKKGSIA